MALHGSASATGGELGYTDTDVRCGLRCGLRNRRTFHISGSAERMALEVMALEWRGRSGSSGLSHVPPPASCHPQIPDCCLLYCPLQVCALSYDRDKATLLAPQIEAAAAKAGLSTSTAAPAAQQAPGQQGQSRR